MDGVRCMAMRGGTSKGLYFLSADLPADVAARDGFLLGVMGSPDPRQIDGMGGANPLTSKVAVVGPSTRSDADVDYLFLQVVVDEARVDASQNCGNILAGVAGFAVERGLVFAKEDTTTVTIHMVNTGSLAVATIATRNGQVVYDGPVRIDGVPGTGAAVSLSFLDIAGSSCGSLLPTGQMLDIIDGISVTCIDNGMPVVLMRAADLGCDGNETPATLEADAELKARVEAIRLLCGPRMNLGNVASRTVPKMCLIAPPLHGGTITTRTFIPHRVHDAIGVLGAVSVATACAIPGTVADGLARKTGAQGIQSMDVEHPSGFFTVEILAEVQDGKPVVRRSALVRTARKLMDGVVYAPEYHGEPK